MWAGLLGALLVASAGDQAMRTAQEPVAPAATKPAEFVECRLIRLSGSHVKKELDCRRESAWKKLDAAYRDRWINELFHAY